MILFFDTETTGLPKNLKASITDFENWPRLVQLAYQLFDDNGNLEIEDDYLVKPYGFKIPLEATNIHGITHEKAFSQGINISNVLNDFKILLDEADIIVAHNLDYDEKIIGCEFLRLKLYNPFINKHKICTMKSSTNFCAINGPNGYKWPSLSELHNKLFNTYFEEAHNAMIDIQTTSKCFWELLNRGIIKENKTLVNLGTKIKEEDENDLIISNPIKELLEERQTLKNRLERDGNRSNYLNTSWVFEDKEGQGENIMEMETLNYKSIEIESEIDRIEKLLKGKGYIIGDNSQIIKIKLPEIKLGGNFSPENLMEKQHFNVPSLIPYRKKDKWGFCNPDKNIIIDCKYDYAEPFIKDYAQIEINNKKFRIDLDNNISEITNSFYEGLCMNMQNEKLGFIDANGKIIIPHQYDSGFFESNQLYKFSEGLVCVKKGNYWGFIDKSNQVILPFVYEDWQDLYKTSPCFDGDIVHVKKNDKWGFINRRGEIIIPFIYDDFNDSHTGKVFSEGLGNMKKGNNWGYINRLGDVIIPFIYEDAAKFNDGLAAVQFCDNYGFINKEGNAVIPFTYEYAISFNEGLAVVKKDKKYGFIDNEGTVIIPYNYIGAESYNNGLAKIYRESHVYSWQCELMGYIDKNGIQYWED